jgi:hypothetical protein
MAPKHGLGASQAEDPSAKRVKSSDTPASRSATPADVTGKVPFQVNYPPMDAKRKLSKKEQELVRMAERQESPFVAKGASQQGELDQYYTVTPFKEWAEMKKYNNFISKLLQCVWQRGYADKIPTVQGEMYKNSHFVYVRGQDTPKGAVERDKDFWVARILQVRAANPQHVYALVSYVLIKEWNYNINTLGGMDVLAGRITTTKDQSFRYR